MIVTDVRRDAMDAAALGARDDGRAGVTRERSQRAGDRCLAADGEVVWS
jgi:hypothetical protein